MGFLSLIPIKDWIYVGIIAALLAGFAVFVHHERALGAQRIEAADAAATAKTLKAADARIVALNEDYKSKLQETQNVYTTQLVSSAARADLLASSLRNYQNHRCGSPVLQSASAPGGSDGAGTGNSSDAAAELTALQAERNSLTGK
jgi:hypothetical protein